MGVQSRAMAHATCESFRALQLKADFARLVPDGHAGAGRLVRRVGKGSCLLITPVFSFFLKTERIAPEPERNVRCHQLSS